ncbi:MAG: TIGR04190 family B12-binding domain/radical SAM domain protein [Actinomycetia bacterium]|nr:TIGR04190 family B12-binding domain/radical SAM domain protein [Actinomycetes bacterium]
MARTDVVLLHAPAVYDFRQRPIMFGPVSDLVPSTPIFEVYPLGLSTIAEYLERSDYHVRTVNLAYLMLRSDRFDVERAIRKMDPLIFGIDLHWMPHSHGAIEVARICKTQHPDTPVIIGGLSASVFHDQLLEYECVDFVLRGDSTEEPFKQLMDVLSSEGTSYRGEMLASVPNLSWKDESDAHRFNELSWAPADFNGPALDFAYNMKSVLRYRDLFGSIPFKDWLRYPMGATITCRGCTHDCATCGGSATTFRKHFGRDRIAFRDPELLARELANQHKYLPGPIFVLNDFLQAGTEYARTFLNALGKEKIDTPVGFEFFGPPSPEIYELLQANLADWTAEISVETHDDAIRAQFGKKHYTMVDIEQTIHEALAHGATRFDLYFMMGIPGQDARSALETVQYCKGLYERLDNDPRLLTFTSPMAPFLDPGSKVYDDPDHYGYRLRARTVEEHRQLLLQPSWKQIMNYESELFGRDELVETTYEAGLQLNRIKAEAGAIDPEVAEVTEIRIKQARDALSRVEEIDALPEPERSATLHTYSDEFQKLSESTVCEKSELEWDVNFLRPSNMLACAGLWAREEFGNLVSGGKRRATSDIHERFERGTL